MRSYVLLLSNSPVPQPLEADTDLVAQWMEYEARRHRIWGNPGPFMMKDGNGELIAAFSPGAIIGVIYGGVAPTRKAGGLWEP